MKILVREVTNEICNYVWKTVTDERPFGSGRTVDYYKTTDGSYYLPISIIKITHDYRTTGYVVCKNCGKVVKKSKIEKHYKDQEKDSNCMKCEWLRIKYKEPETHKMREDGKCISSYVGIPYCAGDSYCWHPTKISEVNKIEKCKYFACRRSETIQLQKDFLSENPNPYKIFVTENAVLNTRGWTILNNYSDRQYATQNGKLIATFDTNGILKYFSFLYRNDSFDFTYSDVYDKFMYKNGTELFKELDVSEATKKKIINNVKALYENC